MGWRRPRGDLLLLLIARLARGSTSIRSGPAVQSPSTPPVRTPCCSSGGEAEHTVTDLQTHRRTHASTAEDQRCMRVLFLERRLLLHNRRHELWRRDVSHIVQLQLQLTWFQLKEQNPPAVDMVRHTQISSRYIAYVQSRVYIVLTSRQAKRVIQIHFKLCYHGSQSDSSRVSKRAFNFFCIWNMNCDLWLYMHNICLYTIQLFWECRVAFYGASPLFEISATSSEKQAVRCTLRAASKCSLYFALLALFIHFENTRIT